MKTRLAKKIWLRQWHKVPPYWWQRILDSLDGKRKDHGVTMAAKITKRKKTRRKRHAHSGDSDKG